MLFMTFTINFNINFNKLLILQLIFSNKYQYNIYINNKFCPKRDTIFLHLKEKYLNKIQTNKLGTKLKQMNIYGY